MAIKPLENETHILTKVAQGDEHSFALLFRWYSKPLAEFIFKLTNSIDATEDIIQESFIKIWLRRETLPEISNFGGYLFILCRNEALLVLKKQASKSVAHAHFEKDILNELKLEESENLIDEYRDLIQKAVGKLPEQQQKVYKLSRYERLKHEEIAKALNLSPQTVKKHIQLAIQFIKKDIGAHKDLGIIFILTNFIIFK